MKASEFLGFVAVQVLGALAGVMIAHLMFNETYLLSESSKDQDWLLADVQ